MKIVTVITNQSLLDVAIQELGNLEGVFALALTNKVSVTDSLEGGMMLKKPSPVNIDISNYFKNKSQNIVSNNNDVGQYVFSQTLPFIL